MKQTLIATIAAVSAAQGVTILSEANYDGINTLTSGNANSATVTVSTGNAPSGSNGEVGIVESSGTNVWGATQNAGNAGLIDLPTGVLAGTDTFTASFRVFIPSNTTFTGTDRVNLIVRRNGNNAGGTFANNNVWNSLAADEWHIISITETIPAFENDGTTAVTGFTPIISFYDRTDAGNAEAGVGTSVYIDDWSFSVTTSAVPEPSSSMAALLGFGLLGLRRKR